MLAAGLAFKKMFEQLEQLNTNPAGTGDFQITSATVRFTNGIGDQRPRASVNARVSMTLYAEAAFSETNNEVTLSKY